MRKHEVLSEKDNVSPGGVVGPDAMQTWGLFNHLYQCSISVYTPAKSRENKESKMQVNKLIDDLHKQLLQQGKKQSHIGFSALRFFYSFTLNSLVQAYPGNVTAICKKFKELSILIWLREKMFIKVSLLNSDYGTGALCQSCSQLL